MKPWNFNKEVQVELSAYGFPKVVSVLGEYWVDYIKVNTGKFIYTDCMWHMLIVIGKACELSQLELGEILANAKVNIEE